MRVIEGLNNSKEIKQPCLVTLGNFDGVHLGHQRIVQELVKRARQSKASSVLVTFNPHPRKVLDPHTPLQMITSLEEKIRLVGKLDVDQMVIIPFDLGFSRISAESFVRDILFPSLKFLELIVGRNFSFGRGRQGNVDLLKRLSVELGYKIDFVEPVQAGEKVVSSSLIRQLIHHGNFKEIPKFLGRPYSLFGRVVKGQKMGKKLGFPTANLDVGAFILPPRGVYAVRTKVLGEKVLGLANIGVRPTFTQDKVLTFEVHLLDFDKDIYGEDLEVTFLEYIRDERFFQNQDQLCQQIEKDIEGLKRKVSSC
ncbi:MAG: bifunctional riboflavin kinase/FAD synthetase [Chlamydiae bacterium]|nr:bifunctional riboflavin kinase/FAD synthetase [Chlamydiota bacterium]MBI3277908.1 bifunctional riboflavin kinase/FAD synthetase [Chlamydiota bacterium]